MNMKLINTRRNNKIYVDDKGNAYKIFKPGYSKTDVFMEAFITSLIEGLGINVPTIREISMSDGQWVFKFPHCEGVTLYQKIQDDPGHTEKYLRQLVEIQTEIHRKKCPHIPVQREKLTEAINKAHLDKGLKIDLLDMLNSSPKHRKLCHGNFTPHNVVLCEDGPYVLDWNHASQGNASADVARTYIWMQLNMPDYAEAYLELFCDMTNTATRYVHNWIPIMAAARLSKNNPEELKLLHSMISVMEY